MRVLTDNGNNMPALSKPEVVLMLHQPILRGCETKQHQFPTPTLNKKTRMRKMNTTYLHRHQYQIPLTQVPCLECLEMLLTTVFVRELQPKVVHPLLELRGHRHLDSQWVEYRTPL